MCAAKISDSDFTIDWLQEVLQKDTGTKSKITDFSFSEIGYGRGFVSQILIVKLTWDTESDLLPKSVALKIPSSKQWSKVEESVGEGMDEKSKEMFEIASREDMQFKIISAVHKCEVSVYEAFRTCPPNKLKIPKCYFGLEVQPDHQGILVFEDLSEYAIVDFVQGLDLENMMEIAEQIAYLHAYSFTTEAWKNEKNYLRFDVILDESLPTQEKTANSILTALKADCPEMFDPLADKANELCQSLEDISYVYKLNEKLGLPNVLAHGDLHCQNLIFEQPEEGSQKNTGKIKAIVDWQVGHIGNICEDFVRIFASSVSFEIRRSHYVDVLKHYYESLEKTLGSKPPFSFDMVLESYKRCFKSGVNCILPIFMFLPNDKKMMQGRDKEQTKREIYNNCKALLEDELAYENEFK